MNKEEFIQTYMTTFLASYMASRFDSDCMNGWQGSPHHNQPIEDAIYLANCAWGQMELMK